MLVCACECVHSKAAWKCSVVYVIAPALCLATAQHHPPQLYIKVSEDLGHQQQQQQQQQTQAQQVAPEEVTDTAMALLDPHLPLLSHYWLAALQDHAHLSLPPQFSHQLPPSGGMFYSNNVAESVKPYFDHNWPSLLHAAAIWLQTTGLREEKQEAAAAVTLQSQMPEPLLSTPGTALAAPPPLGDPKRDRFHLVLGLAVQTLCTPASLDAPATLLHCLKALHRLVEADYVRNEINSDPKLAIEILHLLHRLLLTCQSRDLHVIVMQIAVLVGRALQGRGRTEGGNEGLGREDTKQNYEKTPMFALLEVSACCLLQLVPDLRPKEQDSSATAVASHSSNKITSGEMVVASHAMSLLTMAMSLCSVQETENALPTVLHMLLHTVKFASLNQPLSTALLSSCIRSLQQLISHLSLTHPMHGHQLSLTLSASLTSLLGGVASVSAGTQTGSGGTLSQTEREVKLLVLTVLLHAPSPAVCPPGSQLFAAALQLFKDCLFSPDAKVESRISFQ